jgi:hypothetical protein
LVTLPSFSHIRTHRHIDIVGYSSSTLAEFGRIAAPSNQTGSTTISTTQPRLRLVGVRRERYAGNVVDKIGAFGGWTYGNVQEPCTDITDFRPGSDLICVAEAQYASADGDSGAPILIWYLDDRADIAGIHGGYFDTGTRFFSRFDQIESELGSLGSVY